MWSCARCDSRSSDVLFFVLPLPDQGNVGVRRFTTSYRSSTLDKTMQHRSAVHLEGQGQSVASTYYLPRLGSGNATSFLGARAQHSLKPLSLKVPNLAILPSAYHVIPPPNVDESLNNDMQAIVGGQGEELSMSDLSI